MQNHICPYLGTQEDPQTRFEYPANGNRCYKARPVRGINLAHQREVCLQAGHVACPVYNRSRPGRLPPDIAAPRARPLSTGGRLVLFALAAAVFALGIAFTGGLTNALSMLGVGPAAIPVTGQYAVTPTPFRAVATYTVPISPMGGLLFEFTQSPNPTFEACPQPGGWTVYVVKPTDSLLRLSMIYDLSVEELQAANCMGSRTTIRPGDRLYVPVLPTTTQLPTATPTRVVIVQPPVPVAPTEEPEPDPPDPTEPPPPTETAVPVVQPPTESDSPAAARPTDKPTKEPKPTKEAKPTKAPKPTDENRPPKPDPPKDRQPPDADEPPGEPGPPSEKGPPDNAGPPSGSGPPDDKGPPDNLGPPDRDNGNSSDRGSNPGRGRPPDRRD